MSIPLEKKENISIRSQSKDTILLKRILYQVGCFCIYLFFGTLVLFIIAQFLPDSPYQVSSENVNYETYSEQYGLGQSKLDQFFKFLILLLSGNWGNSQVVYSGIPISELISSSLPKSLEICFIAVFLALPISILFGWLASKYKDSLGDRCISFISKFNFGVPLFVFGLLFQYFFVIQTEIFPFATNYNSPRLELEYITSKITGFRILDSILTGNGEMLKDTILHLVMPCFLLSLLFISIMVPAIRRVFLNLKEKNQEKGLLDQTSMHAFNFGVIVLGLLMIEATFNLRGLEMNFIYGLITMDVFVTIVSIFILLIVFVILNFVINLGTLLIFSFAIPERMLISPPIENEIAGKEPENLPITENSGFPDISTNLTSQTHSLSPNIPKHQYGFVSYLKKPSIIIGIILLSYAIILAIRAPLMFDETTIMGAFTDVIPYGPADAQHPLGTGKFGRDILAGTLFGIRNLLTISVSVAFMAFVIGSPIGFVSGYLGGKVGKFFMVCGNIFMLIPLIILRLSSIVSSTFESTSEIIFLSIFSTIIFSQLTRNLVLNHISPNDKILKTNALIKELLPKIIGLFFYLCTFIALLHSCISYLGYSDPLSADLGGWISNGRDGMYSAIWAIKWPGLGIFLVSSSFLFLSHGLSFPPRIYSFREFTKEEEPILTEIPQVN